MTMGFRQRNRLGESGMKTRLTTASTRIATTGVQMIPSLVSPNVKKLFASIIVLMLCLTPVRAANSDTRVPLGAASSFRVFGLVNCSLSFDGSKTLVNGTVAVGPECRQRLTSGRISG